MLKIRNDVDLKELEKFGFKQWGKHSIAKRRKNFYFDCTKIEINIETKEVICTNMNGYVLKRIIKKDCNKWLIENINALKEAGLIEK